MAEGANRSRDDEHHRRDRRLRLPSMRAMSRLREPPEDPQTLPFSMSAHALLAFSLAFGADKREVLTLATKIMSNAGKHRLVEVWGDG